MPNHRLGEQNSVGDEPLVPCAHATPPQHPCVTGSEGHHTGWGLGEVVVQSLCLVEKGNEETSAAWVSWETPETSSARKNHARES